ncbi:MAG: hypothetical protein WCV90_01575 [Candidatus Woesearchaeota archaeon]|jgi:hypothetical protein
MFFEDGVGNILTSEEVGNLSLLEIDDIELHVYNVLEDYDSDSEDYTPLNNYDDRMAGSI